MKLQFTQTQLEYQGADSEIKNSQKQNTIDLKKLVQKNLGEVLFKKNKDIHLVDATYTACNIDDPDWELTSTSTKLFNEDERGHSYNMVLKYKKIPIFYHHL